METPFYSRYPGRTWLILTTSVLLVVVAVALFRALTTPGPSVAIPPDPPRVQVFHSDLSINSPHPVSTPADINDWLHQIAH